MTGLGLNTLIDINVETEESQNKVFGNNINITK